MGNPQPTILKLKLQLKIQIIGSTLDFEMQNTSNVKNISLDIILNGKEFHIIDTVTIWREIYLCLSVLPQDQLQIVINTKF